MEGIKIDFCTVILQDSVKNVLTQIVLVLQTNIIGQKAKMNPFLPKPKSDFLFVC